MSSFKIIIIFCLMMASLCAEEKKTFKIIMVLWNGSTLLEEGFVNYLKSKEVSVDIQTLDCQGDRAKCHAFVTDIKRIQPDLITIWGTPALQEIAGRLDQAKENYIWDIPIIALIVSDPVRTGIIAALDRPGRNVTGVSHLAPIEAQLNALLLYKKDVKTIGAMYNPDEPNSKIQVENLATLAEGKGIRVILLPVPMIDHKPDSDHLCDVVEKAASLKADFIYIPADTFLSKHAPIFINKAHELKIPTFAATESLYWHTKPMLGMFSHFFNVGMFGGAKAFDILVNKQDPGTMPYEKLSRFSIVISRSAYESMGISPPLTLLKFAEIRD